MKKKIIALMLLAAMAAASVTTLAGCGGGSTENTDNGDTSAVVSEVKSDAGSREVDTKFVLEYPEDMQKLGFTETLELEEAPKRIVCLSTSPVLALHELGANLVGVPVSTVVVWPEDLLDQADSVTFSAMSDSDFDFESILALEPDLIMLASAARDTAGKALESLGQTVYYVYAGHTVSYDSVKLQTEALVDAFDMTEESIEAGDELLEDFDDLEDRLADAQKRNEGKTVLVLQSNSSTSHYAQTKDGTLGSMLDMIGFTNVYVNETSSLAQVDMEQMLFYDPDYIVCVGASSAEYQEQMMEEAFKKNPDYWNSMKAVQNGNMVYLDVSYISSAGINVIEKIDGLIDIMDEVTGA